jgi:hypothetical protein
VATSSIRPAMCVPALLTTMSIAPKARTTSSTSAAMSSGLQMSATNPFASTEPKVAIAASSLPC